MSEVQMSGRFTGRLHQMPTPVGGAALIRSAESRVAAGIERVYETCELFAGNRPNSKKR